MRVTCWNINGIRAAVGKAFLDEVIASGSDIYCVQETKAHDDQVIAALKDLKGYHIYSNSAERKGYSGVAVLTKEEPAWCTKGINQENHDSEGRVITLGFKDFILVNVYVPNSGDALSRLDYRSEWDQTFANYLNSLIGDKPVLVTGDFNVAHQPIDLARPKDNYNKTSGYTQVEIDGLTGILDKGYIDTFRHLNPDTVKYTFWSQRFGARARNVGWRIDYFLIDSGHKSIVKSSEIHNEVMGSDHCPLSVTLEF